MNFFDLHCDAPHRMYREKLGLDSPMLETELSVLSSFSKAVQVYAVYSDHNKNGSENFSEFLETVSLFEAEAEKHSDKCILCKNKEDFSCTKKVRVILAVEGANLLEKDLSRLSVLYSKGVRILTFTWKGRDIAGGAHDTTFGLSDFGKELLYECERIGIVVDVSHMSEKGFFEVASLSSKPFIASHSNSSHICDVTRNLSDIAFRTVSGKKGLVGVNLYPPFLSKKFHSGSFSPDEYISALCRHILHFLSLGGEKTLCLGGDRDGIQHIDDYTNAAFAVKIYEKMQNLGVSDKIIKDIFYNNAANFFTSFFAAET